MANELTTARHVIEARKNYEQARRLLLGIGSVSWTSGNPDTCEALRLGVGMATFPLEIARCHLDRVRLSLSGPEAPRATRLIRALGLDTLAAEVEQQASNFQDRALACLNGHRVPGEPHVVVTEAPRAQPALNLPEGERHGLIEFDGYPPRYPRTRSRRRPLRALQR